MTKKDDRVQNELIALGSAGAGKEAASLLADELAAIPFGDALTGMIPRLPLLALALTAKWAQARSKRWQERVYAELGDDPTKVKEQLYARPTQDPHAARAIVDSYSAMLEAEDDAVVPTLAATAAWYSTHGGPDLFFRNFARFLRDLSAAMFGMTCRLFEAPTEAQKRSADDGRILIEVRRIDGVLRIATGRPNINAQLGESQYEDVIARWPNSDEEVALSTIDLLKQHRVAWMGGWGSADGTKLLVAPGTIEKARFFLRE